MENITKEEKLRIKIEKRHLREAKEIEKLTKEKSKPKSHTYFWWLLLVLTMIYIVDEITTNLHTTLLSQISQGIGIEFTKFAWLDVGATILLILSMFYKPLADRWGRKPFLVINTLGMAAGLLICFTATEQFFWTYFIGFFFIRFFVTPDEQVVYIFETSKNDKRATTYSIIKGVAELGLVLIPLFRSLIMGGNIFGDDIGSADVSRWRYVFLIPAIIAFIVSFIALFFARETDQFIDDRLAYLNKSDEQRAEEAKEAKNARGGFFSGLKIVFKDKQLLFLIIATLLYTLARCTTGYYEAIINNQMVSNYIAEGYLKQTAESLASAFTTRALFFFPFSCSALTIGYGFLSDKIGRKKVSIILLSTCVVSFSLFICAVQFGWSEYIIGLLIGLFLGSFWGTGDTYIMIAGESAPTNLRATVMSTQSLFYGVGQTISSLLAGVVLNNFINKESSLDLSIFCLVILIPCFVASLVILMLFTKETKGRNLENLDL